MESPGRAWLFAGTWGKAMGSQSPLGSLDPGASLRCFRMPSLPRLSLNTQHPVPQRSAIRTLLSPVLGDEVFNFYFTLVNFLCILFKLYLINKLRYLVFGF